MSTTEIAKSIYPGFQGWIFKNVMAVQQKILFFSSNNTNKHAAEYKTKHLFSVKSTIFCNLDSFSKPVSISRKFFIKKNETQFTTERASALLIELWHRYNLFPRQMALVHDSRFSKVNSARYYMYHSSAGTGSWQWQPTAGSR